MTLLTLNNVSLHYPGRTTPVLQQVSYEIQAHDFVILLGTNGSGKSTLLKLLQGENFSHTGSIHFLNRAMNTYSSQNLNRHIVQLTQDCNGSLFPSLTVYENYLLTQPRPSLFKTKAEKKSLRHYLCDFNPNLSEKLDTPTHILSGGEKQAFALALCLLNPPLLLLLDEHTSALDPKTSEQIMNMTQKKTQEHGITCIATTHDLDMALRYGNRILMLHEGRVSNTFDTKEKQQLSKEKLLQYYY